MKIGKANVAGREFILCITPRVLMNLQERTGHSIAEELKAIDENFDMKGFIDLMHDMLIAGDVYATRCNIEHYPAPSKDDLYDLIGLDDFANMFGAVAEAVEVGSTPDIEVVPKK